VSGRGGERRVRAGGQGEISSAVVMRSVHSDDRFGEAVTQ